MAELIEPIARLARAFAKLPGIGAKGAQRLAFFMLRAPDGVAEELAQALVSVRSDVRSCSICGSYTDTDPCAICADGRRAQDVICVVRDARDILSLERARDFQGTYHVLGGTISPIDGIGPEDLRIRELLDRVQQQNVREVILATNPDIGGETTAIYLARLLKPLGVRVSRIAHGVPVGGDLEYTDEVTLARALQGRTEM